MISNKRNRTNLRKRDVKDQKAINQYQYSECLQNMCKQINDYFVFNKLLRSLQIGYRSKSSTTDALYSATKIRLNVDNDKFVTAALNKLNDDDNKTHFIMFCKTSKSQLTNVNLPV